MRKVIAGWLVSFLGVLGAQSPVPAPASEPLDLEALARQLDPGETPTVADLLPRALVEDAQQIAAGATLAQIDEVLLWDDRLRLAVAGHVLQQSDEDRRSAAGLWREICACIVVGGSDAVATVAENLFGPEQGAADWTKAAKEPARRRARALGARLLREHGADPAAAEFLLVCGSFLDPGPARAPVRDEAIRRLGDRVTADHWLLHARVTLRELDVARAQTLVAAAAAARQPASQAGRRAVAQGLFDLRRRLAAAQRQQQAADQPGLAGQIARLRFLQAASPQAAVEESRRLAAAAVEHALPFSILATEALMDGRKAEGDAHLLRAAGLPGRDVLTAGLTMFMRLLPLVRSGRPENDDAALRKIAEVCRQCDAMLADDDSEEAALGRWLRKELRWGEGREPAIDAVLPQAIALGAAMPDSLPAYQLLLATALFTEDAAAAQAALLRPLPAALAALHDVAWLRASIYVLRDLGLDRAPVTEELEQVLGDLERVQQDPGDASYLRGVRWWWESTRPRAAKELRERARACFAVAQRAFGQPGLWRAASALCVADAALGTAIDFEQLRRAYTREGTSDPSQLVAFPTLSFLRPGVDRAALAPLGKWLPAIDHEASRAVVHSACASARRDLGDVEGARAAGRIALEASATGGATRLPLGRGIVPTGAFSFSLGFLTALPSFQVKLAANLWVVPRVMDRAQLQQLVDGK